MFYKAACDFNDNSKIDHLKFMDRYKFYQFVAIFTKTDEINKNKQNEIDELLKEQERLKEQLEEYKKQEEKIEEKKVFFYA